MSETPFQLNIGKQHSAITQLTPAVEGWQTTPRTTPLPVLDVPSQLHQFEIRRQKARVEARVSILAAIRAQWPQGFE